METCSALRERANVLQAPSEFVFEWVVLVESSLDSDELTR
jgi:hypothetical protein